MLRTISCGDVRQDHLGDSVVLAGWVHRWRDHGGLVFIDLRDREGVVQVVFNPELAPEAHAIAERLRSEWVVQVTGTVGARPVGTENPSLSTGKVEVTVEGTSDFLIIIMAETRRKVLLITYFDLYCVTLS